MTGTNSPRRFPARVALAAAVGWLLAVLGAQAFAAPRVALVIGNGDYARFGDLRNPANDARAMAQKLQSLGFRLVGDKAHVDVTRQSMASLLGDLEDVLAAEGSGSATTVLVYYSGHGVAEVGSNWLVPVNDEGIRYREDVPDLAIGARSVMRRLEGRRGGLNILILDACRNNPLPSRRKTKGALSKGLARMDAPSNSVIVYAAAPGQVAYDGAGELSPFTGALLAAMDRPGRRLMDVLGATAAVVERETEGMPEGRQEPWLEMKPLREPFYFLPPVDKPDTGPDSAGGAEDKGEGGNRLEVGGHIVTAQQMETEREFWTSIKDSRNPAKFKAYLKKFGERGQFSDLARIELDELERAGASEAREMERLERERALREPERRFRDCEGRWCPELVAMAAGSFMMGSPESEEGREGDEGPRHEVTISESLAVGVYEVTFSEWDACVSGGGCNGYRPDDEGWGRGRRPVINVSWEEAQSYVEWLSRETGKQYRLLSESEWEYVARGGTGTPFCYGGTLSTEQANYNGNHTYGGGRKGGYRGKTVVVGSFSPNEFGLHDVHGNVWEWVEDCWHNSYRGAPRDGSAWTSGGNCGERVVRGGSWNLGPWDLRSANRYRNTSGSRYGLYGFRVARTLMP